MDRALLDRWRADTPGCANVIHLSNAGASLMPRPVIDAMVGHINREANFGAYESADDAADAVQRSYANVAELLGAQPRNVAVVENATVAFFQALSAFDFKAGDVVVTTRNDYISNQLAYLSLAKRQGVEIRRADDLESGGVDPQSVRDLLRDPKVRLLAVTWVPTNSGLIQPVERLGQIAQEARVPYLVDACQAVGELAIDVSRLRCDFLSATARKFLRGPRGIGFLYIADGVLERNAAPLYIDMRGASWMTADSYELAPDARRFENWEFSYALLLGLGAAARYAIDAGIDRCSERALMLANKLRDKLSRFARVLDRGQRCAAIVTADFGRNASEIVTALRKQNINASATFRAWAILDMTDKRAESALRLSPHYYNTEEEIDIATEALRKL
ncbi:MAG TPA: aminotransferase class V-fold PLP-dependent enzyme [Thermoanaerobaculia bacterium]|nr:aminotransferase class V-fold PLP-dependent enzyme [Thermoanaerobaculia bacterium]